MKNINFAIIGFGGIGRTHAMGAYCANLQLSLPYILNLKTIVSRKAIVEKMPPCGTNCLNIEEALQDPSIDFIDICTPNESHKEVVLQALKYKKAIYCEKPLALNYKEALEMTEAVEKVGVKNAVALMYRYMPAFRLIKEEIEKETVGKIIDFKINLFHKSYLDINKKESWRTGVASGGGALMDLGVHLIDAIHFTLGDIETVTSYNQIYFKEKTSVDEIAECKFKLANNIKGTLEVSRIFAEKDDSTTYTIYGTKGSIKLNSNTPYSIEIYSFQNNSALIKNASEVPSIMKHYPNERSSMGYHLDGHMSSLINFSNTIFNDSLNPIVPTFRDALKAQRVIEAAYISDKEGRKVQIDEI